MTNYHYREIMERGETAISQAKELLDKVKSGTVSATELEKLRFPPIHGPGLDEITQRSTLLVSAYNKLFPNRPRNRPLSIKEHKNVRQEAIKNFEGDNSTHSIVRRK